MIRVLFISGPSRSFVSRLSESLTREQAAEAMSHVDEAHHKGIKFSDNHFPAPGSDEHAEEVARRKAEGLAHDGIHDPQFMKILNFDEYPKPDRYDDIVAALEAKGFTDIDYDKNSAWRPEDERNPNKKKSIQKVLNAMDKNEGTDLGEAHQRNMSRIPAKLMPGAPDKEAREHHDKIKDNYVIRMARHPEEVFGMSADDHPWSKAYNHGYGPDVAEEHRQNAGGYHNWYDRFSVNEYDDYDQHTVTDHDGNEVGTYHTDDSEQEARDHHAGEYPVKEHDDHTEDEPKYHIPDHPELSDKVYDDESDAESARDDWADQNYDFEHPTRYHIYDEHTGDTIYHDDHYEPFETESEASQHAEDLYDNDYENLANDDDLGGDGQSGSCLSVTAGGFRDHLEHEVKQGTHVLYLHHKDDKDFKQPLARLAMRPYTGTDPATGEKHKILRRTTAVSGFAEKYDHNDDREEALTHDGPFSGFDGLEQLTPVLKSHAKKLSFDMFPAREGNFFYKPAPGVYDDGDDYGQQGVPAKMSAGWFNRQDPSIRESILQDIHGSAVSDKVVKDIVKDPKTHINDVLNALNYRGHSVRLDKKTMKRLRTYTGRDAEKVNASIAAHLRDFGDNKASHAGVTTEDIERLINSNSDQVMLGLMSKGSGDPTHVHRARVQGIPGDVMNNEEGADDAMDRQDAPVISELGHIVQDRSNARASKHGGYAITGILAPFAKQIAEKHAEVMKDDSAPNALKGGFGYHPGFLARNPQHTDALFDGSNFTDSDHMIEMLKSVSDKKLASFFDGKASGKINGDDVDYHKIKGRREDADLSTVHQVGRAARFLKPDSPVFSREETPNRYLDDGFDSDDPNAEQKFADIMKVDTHHGAYAQQAVKMGVVHKEINKRIGDKSSAASEAMMHHIKNADFNQVSKVFSTPYSPSDFFPAHHTDAFADKMRGLKQASGDGELRVNHTESRLDNYIAGYIAENHPGALDGYVRHNPRGAMEDLLKVDHRGLTKATAKQVLTAVMHPDSGITGSMYHAHAPGSDWRGRDHVLNFMSQNPDMIDEIMKQGKHPEGHAWHEVSKNIEHPALMAERLPRMTPTELATKAIEKHLGGESDNAARDIYAGEINRRHDAGEITPADSLLISKTMHDKASNSFPMFNPSDEGKYAESKAFRKVLNNHGPVGIYYKDGSPVRGAQATKDLMTADHTKLSADDDYEAFTHLGDVTRGLNNSASLTSEGGNKIRSNALDVLGYTRAHKNFLNNVKHITTEYGESGGGYGKLATPEDHKKMINDGHYDNRPAGIAGLDHFSSDERGSLYKHLHDHQAKTMGDAGKEANKQIVDHMVHDSVHPDPEIGKWQHGLLRQIEGNDNARGSMLTLARNKIMSSPHFGEEDAKWMDATKPEEGHFKYDGMKGSDPRHIGNAIPTSAAGWDYVTKGMTYGKVKDNMFPSKDGGTAEAGSFNPRAVESMITGAVETKWKGMEDRHHKAFAQYAHDHMMDGEAGGKTASNMSKVLAHSKTLNHFGKLINQTAKGMESPSGEGENSITDNFLAEERKKDITRRQERILSSATQYNMRGEKHDMDKDMLSEAAISYFKNGGLHDHTEHLSNDHAAEVINHLVDRGEGSGPTRDLLLHATENMAKSADLNNEHKSAMVRAMQEFHNNAGHRSLENVKYGVQGKDNLYKSLMDNGHHDLHDKILDVAPKIASSDLVRGMSNEEFDRHADRMVRHMESEDKKGIVLSGNAHDLPKSVYVNFAGKLPGTVDKLYNAASRNGLKATNFDNQAAANGSPETALHLANEAAKLGEAEMNPHLQPHHVDQLLKTMKQFNRSATSLHAHSNPEIRHKAMEHELQLHEKEQEDATSNVQRKLLARAGMAQISRVGHARHAMGKDYAPSKEHLDRLVDHHINSVSVNSSRDDTFDPAHGMNRMGRHLDVDHLNKIMNHKADDPRTQLHVRQSGALMALNNSAAMEDRSVREKTLSVLNNSAPYIGKNTISKMDLSNPKAADIMAKHMVHRVVGDAHGFNQEGYVVDKNGEAVGSNNFGDLKAMLKNHAQSGYGADHVANAILKHPAIEASHPSMKGNLAAHAMNESMQVYGSPAPQHVKDTLIKHFPTDHHVESFELAQKNQPAVKNFGLMRAQGTGLTANDVSRNLEHIADPNHPLHALHPEGVRKNLVKVGAVTPSLERGATVEQTRDRHGANESGSLGHPLLPKESVKLVPPKFTTDMMHLNPHQTSAQFDHHFKRGEVAGYDGNITKSKHFSPYHVDKVISDAKSEKGSDRYLSAKDGLTHVARNAKITHEQAHGLMTANEKLTPSIVHNLRSNENTPASFLRDHKFYPHEPDHPAYSDPEHGHHLIAARAEDGGTMGKVKEHHPEAAARYEKEYGGSK